MLKYSPRPGLPLTIFYAGIYCMTRNDEENVLLAILQYRDRVRRIALEILTAKSERLIGAMTKKFPALERLYLEILSKQDVDLRLPPGQTFQAPNIRQIDLSGVAPPMQSPLLTTTRGLVLLWLCGLNGSEYYSEPKHILAQLSLIPQLEKLGIDLGSLLSRCQHLPRGHPCSDHRPCPQHFPCPLHRSAHIHHSAIFSVTSNPVPPV